MISKERLVQITKSAIDRLIATFKANPYFFYTENDLHTYLYHEILAKLPLDDLKCETKDSKLSILLHKEYPTKLRYSAKGLKRVEKAGARGHFDLCIWNPEKTREREFRAQRNNFNEEQQTFIAIEFDMIERNDSLKDAIHHFRWDLLKLRNNEVENGYQLVFVRDWRHNERFVREARSEASGALNTAVLYIEKNEDDTRAGVLSPKTFLSYESILK